MGTVTAATKISRPPHEVFAALVDPAVQITYDGDTFRSVEKLTADPIGKGSRFRGQFKGMGKVEYEYAAFEQDRLIEHASKMPFGGVRHRFEFQPDGSDTRLVQTMTIEPNVLGRVLWPLLMRRTMSRRVETLNGLVKRHVER